MLTSRKLEKLKGKCAFRCQWLFLLSLFSDASVATSGHTSDRATTPDKVQVNPLEYAEDEEPPEGVVEVVEADVEFPNIPVPKSSNEEVSQIHMFYPS
jgi:hypothetical protein